LVCRLGTSGEGAEYLPVAVAATGEVGGVYFQVLYRCATDEGEGCIEVRGLRVEGGWNVWESVTEEDGLLGGICWNLMGQGRGRGGYISVAMASRVYFFVAGEGDGRRDGMTEQEEWTFGRRCLIFEVDVFLQRHVFPMTGYSTRYATRVIHSSSQTISVLVFVSQKTQLQSFKLEISPGERKVDVCAKTEMAQWKSGAKGALIAWSMGRKLMTAHCCEDECAETRDERQMSVFKTWFVRGEKRSLKHLIWEYGGVIVDCWDS
jgi:hypothetical protein